MPVLRTSDQYHSLQIFLDFSTAHSTSFGLKSRLVQWRPVVVHYIGHQFIPRLPASVIASYVCLKMASQYLQRLAAWSLK